MVYQCCILRSQMQKARRITRNCPGSQRPMRQMAPQSGSIQSPASRTHQSRRVVPTLLPRMRQERLDIGSFHRFDNRRRLLRSGGMSRPMTETVFMSKPCEWSLAIAVSTSAWPRQTTVQAFFCGSDLMFFLSHRRNARAAPLCNSDLPVFTWTTTPAR